MIRLSILLGVLYAAYRVGGHVFVVVLVLVVTFMWWRRLRRRALRWEPETTERMLAEMAGRPLWNQRYRWNTTTEDDPWL